MEVTGICVKLVSGKIPGLKFLKNNLKGDRYGSHLCSWQYWVLINDEPKEGTILIEMPYPYIIEMICDWWAFSWIKGDLSEMFAWYKDHADYIKLHNNTRSIVEEILEMIRTKLTEVENAEN